MNSNYSPYGVPQVQPGFAVSSEAVHRAGIFSPNPLFSSAGFSGVAVTVIPNSQYQVTTQDTNGALRSSAIYQTNTTVDLIAFHNWFAAAIAPQFSVSTNATIWNTGGVHVVTANAGYFNQGVLAQTLTLSRYGASATTLVLASIPPRSNNGATQILPGRLLFRDAVLEQQLAVNPVLANFSTRESHIPVRLMDPAFYGTNLFRHFVGISGAVPLTDPMRNQQNTFGIFDTIRVYHQGAIAVRNSSTANFAGSLPNTVLLELNPGTNQGCVTNVASGSTIQIPDTLVRVENVRSYPGVTILRLI